MNNLKKALTREDPKKYQKSKIQISTFKKTSQWDEVEWMMQKKMEKKYSQKSIEENFKNIIEAHFSNGQLRDIGKLLKDLKEKYREFNTDLNASAQNSTGILAVLRKILQTEDGALFKKYLTTTIEKLETYLKQKANREKEKCLNEFNKLLNTLKPMKHPKDQKIEEKMSKLPHSTSATNLRIRVTKEEYQFEDDEPILRKKKSLDFRNKSKVNSTGYKEEGVNKLQMFLKQSNMKLVKTKIEYDYSAIFQASKTNIHSRNKTTVLEPKSEKEVLTKATQGKKNQAFVFYRPNSKKN